MTIKKTIQSRAEQFLTDGKIDSSIRTQLKESIQRVVEIFSVLIEIPDMRNISKEDAAKLNDLAGKARVSSDLEMIVY